MGNRSRHRRWPSATGEALATGLFAAGLFAFAAAPAAADITAGPTGLITDDLVSDLRQLVSVDLVNSSIQNQNKRNGRMSAADIERLDNIWRGEHASTSRPFVNLVRSNPLSVYLTRVQADALGLFTEIFVVDQNGLNVGQSAMTSDFYQGDEAKFQRTFLVGPDGLLIDEPEWHGASATWRAQVSFTLNDTVNRTPIGAVTFELNLTELNRRSTIR